MGVGGGWATTAILGSRRLQPVQTQAEACGYRFAAAGGGGATFSWFMGEPKAHVQLL